MPTEELDLETLLRGVPFFRDLDRVALARLAGALEERRYPAGALVMSEGEAGDSLYVLARGAVTLTIASEEGDVSVADLEAPAHFGELGILLERRTATARTSAESMLWRLPRERFEDVVRERPEIGLVVARSLAALLDRRQRQLIGAPLAEAESRPAPARARSGARRSRWPRAAGATLAIALPLVLWGIAPPPGISTQGWHVVLVLLGASIAWLTELVPDFAVAVAMATAWSALGLASTESAFGGFVTSSWLLALGALALAAAMASSGLLFRAALFLLRAFPASHVGQVTALVAGGALLTPLVPLSVARVAAIARVARELAHSFGYAPRSTGSAALAFAGLVGYWYFSNIFLTGFATNFYILELLPPAERARFDWITWLVAALPAGAVCFVGGLGAVLALFPADRRRRVPREVLARQGAVLGPPARAELMAGAAVVLLIAGLALQRVLAIEPALLALAALVLVSATVLDRAQFRTAIDWGFLVLFGVLLGSADVLRDAGVDAWIRGGVGLLGGLGPEAALLLLALVVMASRVLLPSRPAILLLGLAFVPAAPALGIHSWVAGLVVLLAANVWVLPYQGLEYLMLREATGREAFDDRQGMRIGAALAAVRLVAIAASIPYWRAIGLIG